MLAVAYLWYLLSGSRYVSGETFNKKSEDDSDEEILYRRLNNTEEPEEKSRQPQHLFLFSKTAEEKNGSTEAQEKQLHSMRSKSTVTQQGKMCSDRVDQQQDELETAGTETMSLRDDFNDQAQQSATEKSCGEEENISGGPRFSPPVYIQRYKLVKRIMQEHKIESMVDFGSSDCKITRWLKDIETLTLLSLVDIDGETLRSNANMVKPLNCEFIIRRQCPLTVRVMEGSAGELDGRVAGCQAASLVEVIEHLEPDVLKEVTHCVFGRLRPSLIIVTTPNADFNILFPNFSGFRHWDHKFEWTREEFHEWCEDICTKYGYSVSYTGVGDPPADRSHVGFCSQAAIFTKQSGKPGECTDVEIYKLVQEVAYPYDERTSAERLADRVDYITNSFCSYEKYISDNGTGMSAIIPVTVITEQVLSGQKKEHWTQADVIMYLQSKHTFTEDGKSVMMDLCSGSSSGRDDSSEEQGRQEDDSCESTVWDLEVEQEDWG